MKNLWLVIDNPKIQVKEKIKRDEVEAAVSIYANKISKL